MHEATAPGAIRVYGRRRWTASPLVYRELKVNGGIYLAGTGAMLAPAVLSWFTEQRDLGYLQQVYVAGVGPWQVHATMWPVVFAGIMGLLLFYHDRSRGGLHYVLEGPVRRRDVLRVKAGLLSAAVLLVGVITALAVAAVSLSLGGAQLGSILAYPVVATALAESMAMTALVTSALVPSLWAAAVGAFGFAAAGPMLGQILAPFYSYSLPMGKVPPRFFAHPLPGEPSLGILHLEHWLGLATPTATPLPMGMAGIVTAAIFVAWSLFVVRLGLHQWERVPVEHLDDAVTSPAARGAQLVWWAVVGAFAGVSLARSWWYTLHGWPLLAIGLVAAALPWLLWRLTLRMWGARRPATQ